MAEKTVTAPRRLKGKNRRKTQKPSVMLRVLVVLSILSLALLALVVRLVYLQVFDSSDKYAAQVDQLVDEVKVTAERGDIFDRNMNVLVKDSSAKAVNVIPKQIEDPERVAAKLSESLGMDHDEVASICSKLEDDRVELSDNITGKAAQELLSTLNNGDAYFTEDNALYVVPAKVKNPEGDAKAIALALEMSEEDALSYITAKENSAQLVAGKVDNTLAEQIKEELSVYDADGNLESTNGIELIEDKKRYYTNGNFMSYVLGFTGNDHEGLYGVEKTFNDTLKGTDGIVYYQKDAQGNIITSQTKTVQEAEKGKDLVLSIDSNIQSAAEKILEQGVEVWGPKSATAIVMNTRTGEIVAMASKPDYDLNDPYKVSDRYYQTHAGELEGLEKTEQAEQMWRNPAVSFIYEPGSTFKPITVATALEEGAITPTKTVNCTGTYTVENTLINCTGVHGEQTIPETLENSCNPGLVQIIQDVDPNTFYKYVYNFGFGDATGIELTGEEVGIVNRVFQEDGTINLVDYSTFSFGQGLATTPIQLLTALNALINDGNFVKPTIVKSDGAPQTRQIVSQSTSSELRKDMRRVIESKPELLALTGSHEMGGKTGTAEKFIDGEYSSEKYVTSFFCFAPASDPIYSAIVVMDEPNKEAFGSTSAAPYAIQILSQALLLSGSNPDQANAPSQTIPECVGQELSDAEAVLKERGIAYTVEQAGTGTIVSAQSLPAQSEYAKGDTLALTVGEPVSGGERTVPNFTGMTVQAVNQKVKALGMQLQIEGTGFAVEQSIAPGTPIRQGDPILVKFRE